jgi:hypothetical protein
MAAMRTQAIVALALVALTVPAGAGASGRDGDDVRVRAACVGGRAELRLRADDGVLDIELRVDARSRSEWRIVLLHERTLVYQGRRRPSAGGYSIRLQRTVPDWPGRETITARVKTATGRSCRLAATI